MKSTKILLLVSLVLSLRGYVYGDDFDTIQVKKDNTINSVYSAPWQKVSVSSIDTAKFLAQFENKKITQVDVTVGGYITDSVKRTSKIIRTFTSGMTVKENLYTLDKGSGTITYLRYPYYNDKDKQITLTVKNNPKEYKEAVKDMMRTVKSALRRDEQAGHSLTADQKKFLRTTLEKLGKYLAIAIRKVSVAADYYNATISMSKNSITTYVKTTGVISNPYTLNKATGTITYIPYPYSREQKDKRVTLTPKDGKNYYATLKWMIQITENTMDKGQKLSDDQQLFLRVARAGLRRFLPEKSGS